MASVTHPLHKEGDFLIDPEEKVFEDVKAAPGEKALVTFHTVAFEGSIGLVNMLQATRLMRKGFETSVLLYGPGVLLGVQRGFPKLGSEAFPGHLVVNQKIGTGLLKRLGYSVDVVVNGAEVLKALEAHVYDVIFLDVEMPEMDGYEAARRVRARWSGHESARPRMIAMTSNAALSDRDLCLDAGMDDYISKPFTVETLRDALERWDRR